MFTFIDVWNIIYFVKHYNWFYEKHYETSKTPSSAYVQAASFFGVIITQTKVVIHLFISMVGRL